ncbi:GreA/GreB family elongation factor [Pseudorhodobacter sp.]|uniref:GreA/GreB family elongation factor n=1 Tax=Pseudorhodobacter sp. TaxID=1934400 RepID=UPI002648B609|nr:GreA/GreB family elongation factor [Pseudorhodobacter sp.]MDN5787483.1 GreA/GreB family elongation factor [Pseudorhodobacter sp.]
MSRAFVKEDGPDNAPLPDLPISPHPNFVTSRGLTLLQAALSEAQARLAGLRARVDRLDRLPEAAAERDIRYLEARLKSAIPVPLAGDCDAVAFGHRVSVLDEGGADAVYTIVGEDEADASAGLIAPHSPLGRALIGAQCGDVVTWRRPAGAKELEITGIAWP